MGNKQPKSVQISSIVSPSCSPPIAGQKLTEDGLNLLPNEILFCIFDYLSPIDIARAFNYDLPRFGALIAKHIVLHGLNLVHIQPIDHHLVSTCLSLMTQRHLSIYLNDRQLSTVLQSAPLLNTLTVIINTGFKRSFLSTVQHRSITCNKLIVEYEPSYHREMNDVDIIPLLSTSVHTLILRNVVFLLDQSTTSYVLNSLCHIRCILKNENDLYELLKLLPMLISIDIRLIAHETRNLSEVLPKHFRIEYPHGTVINFSKFPQETRCYDQTVYSLPWSETNSSLVLRSCNLTNYLNSFPYPLPSILRLTIECTPEPWSSEFVTFLHQTFPNNLTLYTIQEHDRGGCVLTIITIKDRKNGSCTIDRLYLGTSTSETSHPEAVRFICTGRVYN